MAQHASREDRWRRTWGRLAKAVLELAYEDLAPENLGHNYNPVKVKADAQRFFELKRYRPWGRAAGFTDADVEEGYISLLDRERSGGV